MKRAFAFGDRSIEPAVRRVNEVRRVAIIGAGTMGQGIAIDLLDKTDYDVVLLDIQVEALERAKARLADLWQQQVKRGQIREADARALDGRTKYTQDYGALADADIIWEVATERAEIKRKIF
jgi:3-hydroxyacyl-CoA dehydrogenase/enoyl-CoA hydratase/3-hydroxybutyryl-CoA epimerase